MLNTEVALGDPPFQPNLFLVVERLERSLRNHEKGRGVGQREHRRKSPAALGATLEKSVIKKKKMKL